MIRFITCTGEYPHSSEEDNTTFAFYNTVNDHFLSMGGGQTFEDYEDFKLLYETECGETFNRLDALIPPKWKSKKSK